MAIAAFLRAREWLDADRLPPLDAPDAELALPRVEGVCVLLRLDGRVVGIGQDTELDGRMLRRAVGRAVTEALADSTIAVVREAVGDRVTVRLSLEIELAGPLRPLLGRTISEAAARVTPGIDGLALRHGERVERAFPSRMLAVDAAGRVDANLVSLLRAAGLPPKDLDAFGAADRVSLARFTTIRLREPRAGAAPEIVTRAGRTVDLSEVTRDATLALATRLAEKLATQVVDRDRADPAAGVALLGTYNPTADAYDPPLAALGDTALAAVALGESSRATLLPATLRAELGLKAQALAASVLAAARGPSAAGAGTPDARWIAMAIRARRTAAGANGDEHGETLKMLLPLANEDVRAEEALSPETVAWVAAAYAAGPEPDAGARAAALIDRLLERSASADESLELLLPFSLAARSPGFPSERRAGIRRVALEVLRNLRTLQMGESPESTEQLPADLEGVLLLPGALRLRSDASFLPIVPGVVLGVALENGSASDGHDERARSIRRFTRALMQFTADRPWIDGFRNPEALRGLVRSSLQSDDAEPRLLAHGLMLALAVLESEALSMVEPARAPDRTAQP